MTVLEYDGLPEEEKRCWREAIGGQPWSAARFLSHLLSGDRLREHCGPNARLLLGVEDGRPAAFCTYADRDEVPDSALTPWIGFVYTFPDFRGGRRAGSLIERACAIARAEGHGKVYVSTDHVGLYEKYGFTFLREMTDMNGGPTRVYAREL